MSEPRFYVRESSGYPIGRKGTLFTHVSIFDRAYCHREVRRFGAHSQESWTKCATLVRARERAADACARLNAGVPRFGHWPKGIPRP